MTTPEQKLLQAIFLEGRQARCDCLNPDKIVPSNTPNLFGFEYRGSISKYATTICVCGFHISAHEQKALGARINPHVCNNFTPRGPHEFDVYYCGHGGWD